MGQGGVHTHVFIIFVVWYIDALRFFETWWCLLFLFDVVRCSLYCIMAKGRVVGRTCQSCFYWRNFFKMYLPTPQTAKQVFVRTTPLWEQHLVVPMYSLDIQGHILRFSMTEPSSTDHLKSRMSRHWGLFEQIMPWTWIHAWEFKGIPPSTNLT